MAMSSEMRNQMRNNSTLLESLKNAARVDVPIPSTTINEGGTTKIANLTELQEFLSGKNLSYYGINSFNDGLSRSNDCDVIVSVYMMSTKKVSVPKDKNFFSIGYRWNRDSIYHYVSNDWDAERTLEDFIELPKANNSEDRLTTGKIVKMCDAEQIYNLYQDKALAIMRKLFSYPYLMFTGNNLYKKMEKSILNLRTGSLEPVTLYVSYDSVRKKFKYAYNPEFILSAVIDEWMLQKGRYNSLIDCYTYVLAFVITHEMLHIIHHNTTNDSSMGDLAESADHTVSNIIQDSFINCKISRRYMGADGIVAQNRLAPTPRMGIGSKITVRCEHNNGLKKFNNVKEVSDKIFDDVLAKYTKSSVDDNNVGYASSKGMDLSGYEGADIFISIDIKPNFSLLRGNGTGSNTFQRCFNDIVRVLTDGKVHDKTSPISNEEKLGDLDILPDGTLVMVKGTRDIAYVESYNSDDGMYTVVKADISGVDKRKLPEGGYLCVTQYTKSNKSLGRKNRIQIKPYNPEDDAYVDGGNKPKQEKLSQQDIDQTKGGNPPMPPMPPMPGQEDSEVKSLNVGDIVWVRRLHKFGRITSIDNGKFTLEEVVEKPAKIIDDSDNY